MEKDKLTRIQLYELVWMNPLTTLAKRYNISDVGLRKICLKMNIPLPRTGHWQKVKAGKKTIRIELSSPELNEEIVLQELERSELRKEYPWTKLQLEIESDPKLNLAVPSKLQDPDKLIVSSKQFLTSKDSKSYKFEGMVTSVRDHLDITVQPKNVTRALLFMDTFIKLLRTRGHNIILEYRGTYAIIKNERVKIQLRERSKIVPVSKNNWATREFHPTGTLSFKSEGYFDFEWKDGEKRKLEDQLSNILAKLETKIDELHEIQRINSERWEEEKRQKRLKEEYKKRQEMELVSFKNLLNKSIRWREVQILREFIDDAVARSVSNNRNSEEFRDWVSWARRKADWYDPYLDAEDELLKNVDRDTLKEG